MAESPLASNAAKVHRIAVYGSLRKGQYNYRPEMGSPVGKGRLVGAKLFSLGAFPCIVKSDNPNDTVVVEVYDLPDKLFAPIERMELGAGYTRESVIVYFDDPVDDEIPDPDLEIEAYFYHTTPSWHRGEVINGDWCAPQYAKENTE